LSTIYQEISLEFLVILPMDPCVPPLKGSPAECGRTRAAADISLDSLAHLRFGWMRILIQNRFGA
jgi:hypothetical protein